MKMRNAQTKSKAAVCQAAMWLLIALRMATHSSVGMAQTTPTAAEVPSFPRVAATEPEQTAETFRTLHGFQMQLIAAEPLVTDPVDVCYDEDGRAYVAEMKDYPYPEEKGAVPTEFPGRISLLEDLNEDGVFETSHIFADQLSWPTSVVCWKGGVFVAAAPDIWYFRDDNGDRRADTRRRVFSGFSRDNVQAIMNGLRWGLDNRIYGAASGNGGTVSASERPGNVSVTRHDFRFDPTNEAFEAIPGGARFGNSFDDWGNRFVCNIRNPVQHVVLNDSYLARNPLFAPPQIVHDVAESGDQLPVFRISPPETWRVFRAQRWTSERVNFPRSELIGAGYWTSSSGVTIYRGSAYPAEFQGNVFVGEVAGNLVHRQKLEPNGVTFVSRRADANAEFVASTDIWFRPVNFANAPDGTLHVLDMYRETIEHPWSIPDDIKAKLDLRSGSDRGRIYRLAPPGYQFRSQPKLSSATTAELAGLLEHPNGWHRETAQRLLFERQDEAAIPLLRKLQQQSDSPSGRLHALYALLGLHRLEPQDLLRAGGDSDHRIRRHAVQLAESRLASSKPLREMVLRLAGDDSPTVRFQVALTLGTTKAAQTDPKKADTEAGNSKATSVVEVTDRASALADLAIRDSEDPWIVAAVFSSAGSEPLEILKRVLQSKELVSRPGAVRVVRELAYYAAASNSAGAGEVAGLIEQIPGGVRAIQFALVSGLGMGLERQKKNFSNLGSEQSDAGKQLARARQEARAVAVDSSVAVEERLAAIELFRFAAPNESIDTLSEFLVAREPPAIQLAAIRLLRLWPAPEIGVSLAAHWKLCSAVARQEIVEALLSRPAWTETLVASLERDEIAPGQLAITQRARLVNSAVPAIKDRATRLLGPAANTARGEVVRDFQAALKLKTDRSRGEAVFRRECLTCHRMGDVGHDVGPNLNSVRHRSAEEIVVHIFDPNRDVPPQYISHSIALRDGRVLTGLIVSENESSLEIQRAENARDTVFRRDVEDIASSGKSLMPEGMEQKVSKQDVADLVAYLLGK